jgi:hypothetical protein
MSEVTSNEKGNNCCSAGDSGSACCQPAAGNASSCCAPEVGSWKKWKTLVSVIIIIAAIGVGANSFLNGNSAQSYTTAPAKSFSAGLPEIPVVTAANNPQGQAQMKQEEISLNRVLDSLQSLDTVAADKDVVFLVLSGEAQISASAVPRQLGTVANNLWTSGRKVGVFTLKNSTPDHAQLASRFSIKTFPCVIVLGRQGQPSAVAGDITEAGLYNAFVLASTPAACCPGQSSASCCPPQSNAAPCCPK